MKKILLLLVSIISSNFFAMQKPQSKNDCFLTYTKFKALVSTCPTHKPGVIDQPCVDLYFQDFLKECVQEAAARKEKKQNITWESTSDKHQ